MVIYIIDGKRVPYFWYNFVRKIKNFFLKLRHNPFRYGTMAWKHETEDDEEPLKFSLICMHEEDWKS